MELTQHLIKCLICGELNSKIEQLKDNCTEKEGSLISSHLQVIFLLRNILEVRSSKLVIFLKSRPNLESWLSLCPNCTQMVNTCKVNYQLILEAQTKFRTVKQEVIQLLKESGAQLIKQEVIEDEDLQDTQLDIVEEIRGFVYQNQYPNPTNPFISGDLQAYQQLTHKIDKPLSQQVKEEDFSDNQSWLDLNDDLQSNSDTDPSKSSAGVNFKPKGIKNIPCPVPSCPKKYSNDQVLSRHLSNCHSDLPELLHSRTICKTCGKKFGTVTLLKRHIRSVHGGDPTENIFKCAICGIGKASTAQLNEHLKTCKGQSLNCPLPNCEMKFSNSRSLNYHVRSTHKDNLDLFPWRCLECGEDKVFLSEEQLKTHLTKKHPKFEKGERWDKGRGPLICETCGGTYESKYSLTNHRNKNNKCKGLRGLVGVKGEGEVEIFICEICGASFKGKGGRDMHVKVVHERRFRRTCEFCGKGMNGRGRLEEHLWRSHRVGDGAKRGRGKKEREN